MNEQDKVAILCKRVADLADPGPDATKGNCWKCGVEIWVGPNSRRRVREFGAQLFCATCGIENIRGEEHMIFGTPNQLANLNDDAQKSGAVILPIKVVEDPDEYLRKKKES